VLGAAVVVSVVLVAVGSAVVVVVLVEVSEGPPQALREATSAMLAAANARF
jgi:hypothetical protein